MKVIGLWIRKIEGNEVVGNQTQRNSIELREGGRETQLEIEGRLK